jgi:hypothetical protein
MTPVVLVGVSPPSPEIQRRAEELSSGLTPLVRAWIDQQARQAVEPPYFDEVRVRQAALVRFHGQITNPRGAAADALVFLVLKHVAHATQRELREVVAAVVGGNEARHAAQEALDDYNLTRPLLREPPPERAHLRVVPPVSEERLAEIDAAVEAATLQLQPVMDRHSRLIAALFHMMMRISSVENTGLPQLA